MSAGAVCPGLSWATRTIGDEASPEDWASLSEPDVATAADFTNPAAMTRFVATRALLRALVVQRRPALARADVTFVVSPSGRLEVAGHPDLAVSSSHTRSFAAAAVAEDGPVGIDVEALGRDDVPRPAAWLTPAELAGLEHLEGQVGHEADLHRLMLLHLWVAKEAVIKAWPGPGGTTRRRIEIRCHEEPAGQGVRGPRPARVAGWCGAGEAAAEGQGPRAGGAPDTVRFDLAWYIVDDAFLLAIAHRHAASEVDAGHRQTTRR